MPTEKNEHQRALTKELYIFTTLGLVASSVYGLYYGIFLYRNSFDIRILVIDTLLVGISSWAGYMLGTFNIHRSGYLKTLKLAFLMLFLASILTVLLIPYIRSGYPFISIARGIPFGLEAAVIDIFLLKEFTSPSRGRFFNINLSIEFVVAVVVPLIVGGIIAYAGGYKATFILAGLIYLGALFVPVKYNKKPHSSMSFPDEFRLLKQKGVKEFNLNSVLTSGMDQLNVLLIAIVPFLLLGSELRVGALTSGVAVIAGSTAFASRNFGYRKQIRLGYFGHAGRLLSNLFLAAAWTPVAVVVQSLANKGLAAFNDPVFRKLRLSSAEEALGSDLNKEALEFNLITATMSLVGQSLALGVFLVLLGLSHESQALALRYLLVVYGVWKLINYLWVLNMKRRFRKLLSQATPATQTI